MRMITIPNCSYDKFNDMRQQVLDTTPYGLLNDIYDKKNRIGYLYFWDTDYIPEKWEHLIVRPVSTKSDKEGVSEEHAE